MEQREEEKRKTQKKKDEKEERMKGNRSGFDKAPEKEKEEDGRGGTKGERGQGAGGSQESLRGGWKPRQIYPPLFFFYSPCTFATKNNNPESVQKSIKK